MGVKGVSSGESVSVDEVVEEVVVEEVDEADVENFDKKLKVEREEKISDAQDLISGKAHINVKNDEGEQEPN